MNKIILTAKAELEDKKLREWVSKLQTQIETINQRTKIHTLDIRKLKNKISKELKKEDNKNV